jgi:hypothetical protein
LIAFDQFEEHFPMTHKYRFIDEAETVVERDDGHRFLWPRDATNSDHRLQLHGRTNPANLHGRVCEQWREDGGPLNTAPYQPPVQRKVPDDHARVRRRRDSDISDRRG